MCGTEFFYLKRSSQFKMVLDIRKLGLSVNKYYTTLYFRFVCGLANIQSLWFTFVSTQIVSESVREVFISRLEIGTDITYTTLFPPRVTSAHRMVGDVVVLPAPRAFLVEAGVLQEGDLERQTNEVEV